MVAAAPSATAFFNLSAADHNGLAVDSFELLTVKDGKFAILGAK